MSDDETCQDHVMLILIDPSGDWSDRIIGIMSGSEAEKCVARSTTPHLLRIVRIEN